VRLVDASWLLAIAVSLFVVSGCGPATEAPDASIDAAPPDTGSPDSGMDVDSGPLVCGTAGGDLPAGLEVLAAHDGAAAAELASQDWAVTFGSTSYRLADEVAWEQQRFEIDRPTRILGFRVQWAAVPDDPTAELEAGLYPDFGHNGFDMWRFDPLFSGTRCVEDLDADGWVTYALDEPVEIEQPGLVFVGHRREGPGAPSFWFDGSTDDPEGSCEDFDACRGAVNLPEVETGTFFHGATLQIPFDFMVELLVERTDGLPTQTVFAPLEDITLSNRTAFGDFDADGWDDLLTTGPTLYRNAGDGTFVDVTEASGISALDVGGAGVWGDYDNDGCLDVFVFAESYSRADALLHNECDGTFTDATSAAGLVDMQDYQRCGDPANVRSPSPAAAWVDLDADGWLDLYVANFICWSEEAFYTDSVFHARGDGTFEEWTASRGFSSLRTPSRGASPIDADRDGDVDILVNNYRLQRNFYFENAGTGRVVESALDRGLGGDLDIHGAYYYGHTIGVAWGDLDHDGDFDVVQANLAHPRFYDFSDKTQVLIQGSAGSFVDNAGDWSLPAGANGLRYQETHSVPALADFDGDGHLDLVITAVYDGRPTDFYWGNGDGTFRLDVLNAGITTENGWGVATSDWDHDGDLDLATETLFENQLPAAGHFLSVRVIGDVAANRAAIGAVVELQAGGVTHLRQVQGGTGQGGQDSMYLHFGLGDATSVGPIEVTFPGGTTVTFDGPFDADQRLWLRESGTVYRGWAPE
jgi:hypothetical protein